MDCFWTFPGYSQSFSERTPMVEIQNFQDTANHFLKEHQWEIQNLMLKFGHVEIVNCGNCSWTIGLNLAKSAAMPAFGSSSKNTFGKQLESIGQLLNHFLEDDLTTCPALQWSPRMHLILQPWERSASEISKEIQYSNIVFYIHRFKRDIFTHVYVWDFYTCRIRLH